jgi:anti-anti-sigma factor
MRESWSREIRLGADGARERPVKFRVEVEPERDVARVCPIGELDLGTVDEVRTQLEDLHSSGFSRLILDLRRTTFLDSSGLHLAVETSSAAAADGFEFAIVPGPPEVQRAFELCGLNSRLPFVEPGHGGTRRT